MKRAADSPILMAFLRALAFVGLTESIFYRLLPDPVAVASPGLLNRMHDSLNSAGRLTFILGFFFALAALVTIASNAIRRRLWPAGLNGFLAVCLLSLTALGVSAMALQHGPVFAAGFTTLAVLTLLFMAMHAFSVSTSSWEKAFTVSYCAAVLCSTADAFIGFAGALAILDGSRFASASFNLGDSALSAGTVLLTASSVCAFMAFCDLKRFAAAGNPPVWTVTLVSAAPAVGFAAGCLLAPSQLALLGASPEPLGVALLSAAIFLGSMTAAVNLLDAENRSLGYGLLLLMLAGFPLRIVYQDMLMVLGAALLFVPRPTEEISIRILPVTDALPSRDPSVI